MSSRAREFVDFYLSEFVRHFDPKMYGPKLKKARVKAGLSQQEVADKLGVSKSRISQIESGRAGPTTQQQIALTRIIPDAPFLSGAGK